MASCQLCGAKHPGELEDCIELRTGEVILDKFEVGALLGIGGIAAVYSATHIVLRRDVALKILHKRYAEDAEMSTRFVREARATAAANHAAFVEVHDAGTTQDGCAYIEMKALNGRDLYSLRKELKRVEPLRAARIAVQILGGLEALHAQGIVHRDIKSANVFLIPREDGGDEVKLIDLGFAKVADEHRLTAPEQLLGTPYYISPEQYVDPTTVDHRADLFSLGVVLFEVVTGTWPYAYQNRQDLLAKVLHGVMERHAALREPDVPEWLDLVIAKALAHDRAARFTTAATMRAALEDGLTARPSLLKRMFRRASTPPK